MDARLGSHRRASRLQAPKALKVLGVLVWLLAGCTDADAGGPGAGGSPGSGAQGGGGLLATGGAGGAGATGGTGASGGGDGGTPVGGGGGAMGTGGDAAPPLRLPPDDPSFDYQLGGAYPPPAGVQVVSRDRLDAPAAGLYNICYINGFQTQPGEEGDWEADLILRDAGGQPVIDPDWDEMLLDVSDAGKRERIAAVVGGWITGCRQDGFDAVEVDNLDTYARSAGRISQDDAVAYMALLSAVAHREGLAIAQKNATEIRGRAGEMGTDFAVAEECSRYDECGDYIEVYGSKVLMIEYRDGDFSAGCQAYGATHGIVRRDLDLVPAGRPAYVYDGC